MKELALALDACTQWARKVRDAHGIGSAHVFGSAVYMDGAQFEPETSDLDLVVVIPDHAVSALNRTQWLCHVLQRKKELELALVPALGRSDAASPIVSVVPVTKSELSLDIHKGHTRDFFRKNLFRDLLEPSAEPAPLLQAEPHAINDMFRQVAEFTQKVRNEYLAVSASGRSVLKSWFGAKDPVPKEFMRHAAMAWSIGRGTQGDSAFDVRRGLDELAYHVHTREAEDHEYGKLDRWISIQRKGRGQAGELPPKRVLLAAESIMEMAVLAHDRSSATPRMPVPLRQSELNPGGSSPGTSKEVATPNRSTTRTSPIGVLRVNGYKLYYYRMNHKLSLSELARITGIKRRTLSELQSVRAAAGAPSVTFFAPCHHKDLQRLERALECPGKLAAGKEDDFLTRYLMFYRTYKGTSPTALRTSRQQLLKFKTRAVVFDFDGTLTRSSVTDHRTTWERIWVAVGYSTQDCFQLHHRFVRGEFDHQTWCNITRDAFVKGELRESTVTKIADEMQLVKGVAETVNVLRKRGIRLFVVSGSIRAIIRRVLGSLQSEFEEIRGNELVFGPDGALREIQGTPYDFEGKAEFLRQVMRNYKIASPDVLYVGNSCNDVFASRSGARTLCVNPRLTDPDNEEQWTYVVREMRSLRDILHYVLL